MPSKPSVQRRAGARMRTLIAAVPFVLALAACGDSTPRGRSLELAPCRLPRFARAVQCGEVRVPENRAAPNARTIGIFVAVMPANTLTPKPDPLFILAGGPGQAASQLAPFAAQLNAVRRTRDIVLMDQRGTGRSSPLECAAFKPASALDFELDLLPRAKECLAELSAKGIDPAQYTTSAAVADLESVREALGYPKINLWGGSYGTRLALEYLRRHPENVRSEVLDGVAPPPMKITLDVWRTRDAALSDIIAACRASEACRKAHPDPAATLSAIEREIGPGTRRVTIADPHTGAPFELAVTFDLVLAALQPLTYSPELASLIPELLDRAANGDFAPLVAAFANVNGDINEQLNTALHFSVTCAEDAPRVEKSVREGGLADLRTRRLAESVLAICDVWPHGFLPADFAEPVKSDVPVLLLSGALDPVTPPIYADQVSKTLPNSRHVIAAAQGHIVSTHGCGTRLVAAFVETAGFTSLPKGCVDFFARSQRPPFFPDLLGPQP
jgi:pimeloyl-ACP methyl ester carboxylesterase